MSPPYLSVARLVRHLCTRVNRGSLSQRLDVATETGFTLRSADARQERKRLLPVLLRAMRAHGLPPSAAHQRIDAEAACQLTFSRQET